jgi:hypothetical protein
MISKGGRRSSTKSELCISASTGVNTFDRKACCMSVEMRQRTALSLAKAIASDEMSTP